MNFSTPVWSYRNKSGDDSPPTSPIVSPPLLNFSDGSFELREMFDSDKKQLVSAGMSPALRKLLIRPKQDEETDTIRALLRETINLTLAAIRSGLIQGSDQEEEFKINLEENSLYRKYALNLVDPLEQCLMNLNLNDWEVDDLSSAGYLNDWEVDDLSSAGYRGGGRRCGILFIEGGHKRIDEIPDDLNDEFLINGEEVCGKKSKVGPCANDNIAWNSVVDLNSYVDGLIQKSVLLTGINTCITPIQTPKRKTISPPSKEQVARALKFQKCGDMGSPALRVRAGKNLSSPTGGEQAHSHARGKVVKVPRRTSKPKRTYTPDTKQTLITSAFAPKRK